MLKPSGHVVVQEVLGGVNYGRRVGCQVVEVVVNTSVMTRSRFYCQTAPHRERSLQGGHVRCQYQSQL